MMLRHLIFSGETAKHKALRWALQFVIPFIVLVSRISGIFRQFCAMLIGKILWFLSRGMKQTFVMMCVGIFAVSLAHQLAMSGDDKSKALGISADDQNRLSKLLEQTLADDLVTGSIKLNPCGVENSASR